MILAHGVRKSFTVGGRSSGITWMILGLVFSGIFLRYQLLGLAVVTYVPQVAFLFSILWIGWTTLGVIGTWAVWRHASITAPGAAGKAGLLRVAILLAGVILVAILVAWLVTAFGHLQIIYGPEGPLERLIVVEPGWMLFLIGAFQSGSARPGSPATTAWNVGCGGLRGVS